MPHIIRHWFIIITVFCSSGIAIAQAEDSPQQPTPEAEQQVPAVEPISEALADVEAARTAEQDALNALNEAEREFLEAARKRAEAEGETPPLSDVSANAESEDTQPAVQMDALKDKALAIWEKVLGWLKSPAFLAQLGLIIVLFFITPAIAKAIRKRVPILRDPPANGAKLRVPKLYLHKAAPLLRAVLLVLLLAVGAAALKAIPALGQDWLVKLAQSLAVVLLIFRAIQVFLTDPLYSKLAKWILIPLALIAVFGYFDELLAGLDSITLSGGENAISALTVIKLGLFGSLFFWLGNLSNKKGQEAIRSQESLDVGVREIVAKFLQIAIFAAVVIMALSAAGIGLSGLVVIFSALTLGIGLGLQPIAANFVSGMIILFDRTVRSGDYVVLPDGQEGFVEAINMRSTTVETTDGKDIMVPNTTFIENTYENWTHKDPRQRYEVYFTVSYDTDIDTLEDIIIPVFENHPSVLDEPEKPDLELREFGESGINFAVEFWCSGIDDGPNKFTSDLNFAVWRALKKAGVQMPLPQREVRMLK